MPTVQNLTTLKIHRLTHEQYQRELAAGRIDPDAIYLTPENMADYDNSGVFIAIYGETTYAEISAALEKGQMIVCKYMDGNDHYYLPSCYHEANVGFTFTGLTSSQGTMSVDFDINADEWNEVIYRSSLVSDDDLSRAIANAITNVLNTPV